MMNVQVGSPTEDGDHARRKYGLRELDELGDGAGCRRWRFDDDTVSRKDRLAQLRERQGEGIAIEVRVC